MSQFPPALQFLLSCEDYTPPRYQAVQDNNGGGVIAGINSKSFPDQYGAIAQLDQNMRADAVYKFYFSYFWQPMSLGGLTSQVAATGVLDMAVNGGQGTSVKLLQQALVALGKAITVDGHIGPMTLEAANSLDPDRLEAAFIAQTEDRYREIVEKNPDNADFLEPWLARAKKPIPA